MGFAGGRATADQLSGYQGQAEPALFDPARPDVKAGVPNRGGHWGFVLRGDPRDDEVSTRCQQLHQGAEEGAERLRVQVGQDQVEARAGALYGLLSLEAQDR